MTSTNMILAAILAKGLAADDPSDPLRDPYAPESAILAAASHHQVNPTDLAIHLAGDFRTAYAEYLARIAHTN